MQTQAHKSGCIMTSPALTRTIPSTHTSPPHNSFLPSSPLCVARAQLRQRHNFTRSTQKPHPSSPFSKNRDASKYFDTAVSHNESTKSTRDKRGTESVKLWNRRFNLPEFHQRTNLSKPVDASYCIALRCTRCWSLRPVTESGIVASFM